MRVGRDAGGELDRVVDARVDPQRHAGREAVVDDGRDLRTVARDLRLALDHRSHGQQLVRRHVQHAGPCDLSRAEVFPEGDQLLFHEPLDRLAGVHVVGGGEQESFEIWGARGSAVVGWV